MTPEIPCPACKTGGMTDEDLLARARRAAEQHTQAVRDTARFIAGLSGSPDSGQIAEYANLLAREEATLAERQDIMADLGLEAPSVEP
jgi:hypothetical protein